MKVWGVAPTIIHPHIIQPRKQLCCFKAATLDKDQQDWGTEISAEGRERKFRGDGLVGLAW